MNSVLSIREVFDVKVLFSEEEKRKIAVKCQRRVIFIKKSIEIEEVKFKKHALSRTHFFAHHQIP